MLPYLEPHATVHTIDRRGRGASGDGPSYDLEREYEDVATVVDAVAASSGSTVDVLGHSFGGVCTCGAATLTPNIGRLVLYEGWPAPSPDAFVLPPAVRERMDALLAEGKREAALETFVREVVRMPDEEFNVYRTLPAWQARVAAAHTIPRETFPTFDPVQAKNVAVPVLMLIGEDSPDSIKGGYETVAAALPDARIAVLAGQQHVAMDFIPEEFARRVLAFLRG